MRVFIFLYLFSFASSLSAETLIRTIGQVQNHVITSREIEIHKLVMGILANDFQDLKVKDPAEQIIREWLLYLEASSFYNNKISNKKLDRLVSKVKSDLKSKAWLKQGIQLGEVREKIKRRLEADRLYLFKKKASVLPVSNAEIETEYTQNRVKYGNFEFEEIKDKIRDNKIEENLQMRLEQWFQVLEKKYRVQRFSQLKKEIK